MNNEVLEKDYIDIRAVSRAISLCKEKYNQKTFEHAMRVAEYAINNALCEDFFADFVYATAILHDIIEDSDVTVKQIDDMFCHIEFNGKTIGQCVSALSQSKEFETYVDYIKRIKDSGNIVVYLVKLADMKDHFMQTETLTDKLKEKYTNAIGYLL